MAEHHNSGSFSGTSPEVLIGQIAAATKSMRIGSGGVMLSHYSALKVAEQFRVLESFFPRRIDLGIGRAPGSDQLTAAALSYPRPQSDLSQFPRQVTDLLGFLHGSLEEGHPLASVKAQPGLSSIAGPDVWLLGSSDYSGQLAAKLGLPFSFADFFGTGDHGPAVADLYRKTFQKSRYLDTPRVNVTLQVICAPTEEEAMFLASSRNLSKVGHILGLTEGLWPPDEAATYTFSDHISKYIGQSAKGYIEGTPDQAREKILEAAERYGTNDIGIVTNCYSFEDRVRSFKMIADAFGIGRTQRRCRRHLA